MAKEVIDNDVVDEVTDDQTTKVVVVEAKEGIMAKAKKHWKKIAVGAAAVAAVVAVKVIGSKHNADAETDFDDDDSDLVDDPVDIDESTDVE